MKPPPGTRSDSKQPLSKVESGVDDVETRRPTFRRELKRILVNRWPEVMSAYWMTIILFGLTVLFCYSLGVRPSFLTKSNEPKPATDVYFHHIVQGKHNFPFAYYARFLSNLAVEYPSLQIKIFFLVEDSLQNPYPISRSTIYFKGLLGYQSRDAFEEHNKRDLVKFEECHPNVNITVMCLSKFMAMTPLKYKWKTIPVSYLSFYARVFSVWQNGGIGMDLTTFVERYHRQRPIDRRISAILKNHDDGLPETDYNMLLKPIDKEDDRVSKRKYFIDQMYNDTLTMLNKLLSLFTIPQAMDKTLPSHESAIRTHRTKRYVTNEANNPLTPLKNSNTENLSPADMKSNITLNVLSDSKVNYSKPDQIDTGMPFAISEQLNNTAKQEADPKVDRRPVNTSQTNVMYKSDTTDSESPQIVLFYDFLVMSENSEQPIVAPIMSSSMDDTANKTNNPAHLALHSNGIFIAATGKLHVFLDMLITAGLQRMRPYCAIQDTFISQCSGVYKYEAYCNIYGL